MIKKVIKVCLFIFLLDIAQKAIKKRSENELAIEIYD